jgi:protein gp37
MKSDEPWFESLSIEADQPPQHFRLIAGRSAIVMENSEIAWTDNTFNPWIGCAKISDGCDYCYAEKQCNWTGLAEWGPGAVRRVTSDTNWRGPVKWNRKAEDAGIRTKVFCASLADVFDGEAPAAARIRLWELIRVTPFLDWQILTKRPANFRRFLPKDWGDGYRNVWLGVTAENRQEALRRIPILQSTPAVLRFVSGEPLLDDLGDLDLKGIDWMIIGGESGSKHARSFDVTWVRRMIARCKQQRVKVFVKQLGKRPVCDGDKIVIFTPDGKRDWKGTKPELWPKRFRSLAVRQFPVPA